jgi:leucyl-tRNA synthetase
VWEYSQAKLAQSARADGEDGAGPAAPDAVNRGSDEEEAAGERDKTEHLRARLEKWCETAVEKMTEDMDALEMHSAVRNIMRLFDRIKDFEKRVLAREPELNAANREALLRALALHAQMLAPFAPHLAEELWIAFGGDEECTQTPWPGVELGVAA